ncbi:transcriptional regulator [Planococcus shixiaomingii]|uniref:transcriptional regulator n=1 Tax=Planococcus shixiaomingii TaxID=3058393 RepID=UPI002621E108|nr:transcriptional regulator [Planococcus sp. N022]WKA56816.1 transcriptional regulator [Planococcus sp. N022]
MKETTVTKSSGIICKGSIDKNYEKLPHDLSNYVELGLITLTDSWIYMKLTQFYNSDFGYAFPTITQLMIYSRKYSKSTIHQSIKNLVAAGLLQKGKTSKGNNIYRTYKPLGKEELYKLVPEKVQELREIEAKLLQANEADKIRWEDFKQEKG